MAAALEGVGHTVVRAVDGIEGLKRLYEGYPDLIIVARELHMVNGEDVYLCLRQASYLPIIVVGEEEGAVEPLERGADAYMTRPPCLGELLARVQTLLRRMKPCSGASCGGEAPPGRDEASESDNSSCSRGGDANVADN